MIRKIITYICFLLWLFTTSFLYIQNTNTCECPEKKYDDLYSTISKCTIDVKKTKDKKKKHQLSVRITDAKVKRSRVKRKKTSGVSEVIKEKTVVSIHTLKSKPTSPKIIKNLSKKISAEEIAKSTLLSAVRNIPLFPNCKKKLQKEYVKCFDQHIKKNLRYPYEAVNKKNQGDV